MSERRTCPNCGLEDNTQSRQCLCGYLFEEQAAKEPEGPTQNKPQLNPWLALIPGLVTVALVSIIAVPRWFEFGHVASAIGSPSGKESKPTRKDCVDVYAITLKTSEFYVPENRLNAVFSRNPPRELSTVVQGMANNNCGEPLWNVQIRIAVRDDRGRSGSGWAKVGNLPTGQSKPFERAWMGRVTSYQIVEVR